MALLPSLPDTASLLDVMRRFREPMLHLNPFVQSLMRGPSPFSEGERETIAAFVSGLNACTYCCGIHSQTAAAFDMDETLFTAMLDDIDTAPVDDRLKPVLRYVRKLTETPSKMTPADAQAVFAAGWDATALFHAVAVCAYFNLMNRIVEGCGVTMDPDYHRVAGRRLAEHGYGVVKEMVLADGGGHRTMEEDG